MNKGPNATIRLVRRQNHAGTTVSWTTVQREKNSHAYKLSSNVQTACSTDSLNNCPKHSILRFSSFALKIYLWLKMCQHNLPCSIVLPTACFPEGPSPHFTLCSFWRRRPRLEAVVILHFFCNLQILQIIAFEKVLKIFFKQKSFSNYYIISVWNSFNPNRSQCFVGPDLLPGIILIQTVMD